MRYIKYKKHVLNVDSYSVKQRGMEQSSEFMESVCDGGITAGVLSDVILRPAAVM